MNPEQNQQVPPAPPSPQSMPEVQTPNPAPSVPPMQQPVKKGKKKPILLAIALVAVLVASFLIFSFVSMNTNKKAGQQRIEQYMSDVKSDNKDEIREAIFEMLGATDDTSDPAKLQEIIGVAAQTAAISEGLKNVDPELVRSSFGKTTEGNLLVTNDYSITYLGQTVNYIVQVQKDAGTWKLYSLEVKEAS